MAEALRSGINTVPQGQAEAARAIGLDFGPTLTTVVLPQAFRGAIAPLGNMLIALTKNTTVVATIGVAEASYLMKGMIEFRPAALRDLRHHGHRLRDPDPADGRAVHHLSRDGWRCGDERRDERPVRRAGPQGAAAGTRIADRRRRPGHRCPALSC